MKLIVLSLNVCRTIISIFLVILGLLTALIGAGILLLFELPETFLKPLVNKFLHK